jgi:hypothetical protein
LSYGGLTSLPTAPATYEQAHYENDYKEEWPRWRHAAAYEYDAEDVQSDKRHCCRTYDAQNQAILCVHITY